MIILYSLNILIGVVLILSPIWWSTILLRLNSMNPVTIATLIFGPIEILKLISVNWFLDDGIYNNYFQFALMMTNVQLFISLILLWLFHYKMSAYKIMSIIPTWGKYNSNNFKYLSIIFLILFGIAFLLLAESTGGLMDWLANPRESYMTKREAHGTLYALSINFLSVSFFFAGLAIKKSSRFAPLAIMYLIICAALGSKGFVLSFILFAFWIVWINGDMRNRSVLFLSILGANIILLAMFFSNRESIDLLEIMKYFDAYTNASWYYEDYLNGQIDLFHGDVFLTSFYEYIPRSFYPDKPYVYGILKIVDVYYPGGAEVGATPAFNGGVLYFADFGFIGLVIFSLFNLSLPLYFISLKYIVGALQDIKERSINGRTMIVMLVALAPMFGVFIPTTLFLIFIIILYVSIYFFRINIAYVSRNL